MGRLRMAADRGDGRGPYAVTSRPFAVSALTLAPAAPVVRDGVVSVLVRYPDPGASPLALPRLVRTGAARLRAELADGSVRMVTARPDPATGASAAAVPGARGATLVEARDACANATA